MPASSSSSGGKGERRPGPPRANSSTTPWLIAQMCAENIEGGGRFSGGICSDSFAAARSSTPRARIAAAASAGLALSDTPLSNIAM